MNAIDYKELQRIYLQKPASTLKWRWEQIDESMPAEISHWHFDFNDGNFSMKRLKNDYRPTLTNARVILELES